VPASNENEKTPKLDGEFGADGAGVAAGVETGGVVAEGVEVVGLVGLDEPPPHAATAASNAIAIKV